MRTILAAVVVLGLGATAFAQPRAVTIDDILELKTVASPVVAPDGRRVLYTVRGWAPASDTEPERREARTHVWMAPVGEGQPRQLTFGPRGDSQPQFSPDGRYISFVSARGRGTGSQPPRPQIHVMRADGGEPRAVTDAREGVLAYAWSPDSTRLAYVTLDPRTPEAEARLERRDDAEVYEGDFRQRHLWVIEIAAGSRATRVTDGTAFTVMAQPPSWSPDGTRLAFGAGTTPMLRDERRDVYIADSTGRGVSRISTNQGSDGAPAWSPDGRWIAWVTSPNAAAPMADGTLVHQVTQSRLALHDVAAGATRDAGSPQFDLEPGPPLWTPDSARILFSTGRRVYSDLYAYDVAAARYVALTRDRTLQLGSQSRDGSVVAVVMSTPDMPGEIYVTDAAASAFRPITRTNPQASDFALGHTEVVTWKSSDGLEIEGVLLLPVGYQPGQAYPLLVVAHGGPAGAHLNTYRVGGLEGGQLWAGKGWAVLYPNPRGSSNYGERFLRANINDWGGGDYRDIMAGIDALVKRGVADPERLALIGWSYGGYMTAWSITQTTRFKAAMVGAGLTNLWSMYGTNDIPNVLTGYFGGAAGPERLPAYLERSAMTRIDKVVTPTLILHGAQDERVPVGQAQELFRGLKDRGRATELVFYPREGHGISEYYHQKDRLTRIHDWITRHTP